jgi:hypothetical protein
MTRYLAITIWQLRSFFVGRPLWREDWSVFCICCWVFPTQSFSGPSPLVLTTIFYCLRFETSHFVASYDLQNRGGGIRPRLHTGGSLKRTNSVTYIAKERTHITGNTCHVTTTHRCVTSPRTRKPRPPLLLRNLARDCLSTICCFFLRELVYQHVV